MAFVGGSALRPLVNQNVGLAGAERALGSGVAAGGAALGRAFNQAENRIRDAARTTSSTITGLAQGARRQLNETSGQAVDTLNPFAQPGQQANQVQAALSGALGSAAQQDAFNNFNESPGQAFLRDRAETALTRNAAALGGLGGGRVRDALQQNAIGLAQQDLDRQFGRLGTVADRGLAATSQQAGIQQRLGQDQTALNLARGDQAIANQQFRGSQLADIARRRGELALQTSLGTGAGVAGLRERAGQNLAALQSGAGNSRAALINQATGDVADLLAQSGLAQSGVVQNAGNLLSGNAQQTAANFAGVPGFAGTLRDTRGLLGGISDFAGGIGGILQAF